MKTVGKQLQEARLAKNWTPELAARETKIKVERLRDLEGDDYSHFTSPTYARGFVRTYARALGLDEYRILRQLDNKLPDDDSANIVTDSGVAYLPETAMPARAAHRDYTGLYIVMGLGAVVTLAIVFVLFEAYRVGELSTWFASSSEPAVAATTNAAPATSTAEAPARALPIDSNTPPPVAEDTNRTNATSASKAPNATATAIPTVPVAPRALPVDVPMAPRALPVDAPVVGASPISTPAPETPIEAPRALPVDASQASAPVPQASSTTSSPPPPNAAPAPPRALPVNPSDAANPSATTTPDPSTLVAMNTPPAVNAPDATPVPTPPAASPATTTPAPSTSARESNSGPVVQPPPDAAPTESPAPNAATNASPQASASANPAAGKRLVLTASEDSFVRVTNLDSPDGEKAVYAAVLHSGQSIGFDGRKFSVNVTVPSAVDIRLDGVNYGPHSDGDEPETFIVQSHLP